LDATAKVKRETFAIARIDVPVRRRATRKPETADAIPESILENGQQTLILPRIARDETAGFGAAGYGARLCFRPKPGLG
jgi:hypothetical protein